MSPRLRNDTSDSVFSSQACALLVLCALAAVDARQDLKASNKPSPTPSPTKGPAPVPAAPPPKFDFMATPSQNTCQQPSKGKPVFVNSYPESTSASAATARKLCTCQTQKTAAIMAHAVECYACIGLLICSVLKTCCLYLQNSPFSMTPFVFKQPYKMLPQAQPSISPRPCDAVRLVQMDTALNSRPCRLPRSMVCQGCLRSCLADAKIGAPTPRCLPRLPAQPHCHSEVSRLFGAGFLCLAPTPPVCRWRPISASFCSRAGVCKTWRASQTWSAPTPPTTRPRAPPTPKSAAMVCTTGCWRKSPALR